jgi:alpha-galactosidase
MKSPSLGWQSWSPPYPKWHGYPRWDYSPFPDNTNHLHLSSRRRLHYPIIYWCSWYAYDTKINDELIRQTVSTVVQNRLPFTHILIDDGWTTRGDWLTPDQTKFPNFKSTITTTKIKSRTLVLPFLADSFTAKNYPDWLVSYHSPS